MSTSKIRAALEAVMDEAPLARYVIREMITLVDCGLDVLAKEIEVAASVGNLFRVQAAALLLIWLYGDAGRERLASAARQNGVVASVVATLIRDDTPPVSGPELT